MPLLRGLLALIAVIALSGPASADELYGTLKKIKETGTITIGHNADSPPFSFIGADGKPQGYSIDLCMKIAEAVKSELKMDKLEVKFLPDIAQMVTQDAGIDDLNGLPLVAIRQSRLRGKNIAIKRVMDVVVSMIVLVFFSPLLTLISLLVKAESRGPVFYVQQRVGNFNVLRQGSVELVAR